MMVLSLTLFLYNLIFVILFQTKLKLRKEEYIEDINIISFKYFNFINDSTRPIYEPTDGDLGLAGRLFLNCHTGTCVKEDLYREWYRVCNDTACSNKNFDIVHIDTTIYYNCSLDCFYFKSNTCNCCPSDYSKKGFCSLNNDDIYDSRKICVADNLIYFWKGKKYQIEKIDAFKNKTYTYIKDAKLKDEQCPENTKNCGILDDEENKLCLPINSECPPNVISTTKLNTNNYYTSVIDNITVYYAYDENAINNKILAGLYVDTDIYINKEEENEKSIILDTYTISGLINDNYWLYRDVNLGYDPYSIDNIDEKGKSYLKVRYNNKKPNLILMREKHNQYIINKTINDELIKRFKGLFIIGSMIFDIYSFLFLLGIRYKIKKGNIDKSFCICITIIFFLLFDYSILSLFLAFLINNGFNKIKKVAPKNEFNYLRILNIIFIILTCLLYLLHIIFSIIFCLYRKLKKNSYNRNEEIKSIENKTNNISRNNSSETNQTKDKFETNNNNENITNINNDINNIK